MKIYILVFTILLFTPKIVLACDCPVTPIEEAFDRAEAVFTAKAIKTSIHIYHEPPATPISEWIAATALKPQKIWKGDIKNNAQLMPLQLHEIFSNCDFYFEPDKEYLVYASKIENKKLFTDDCGRTKLLKNAKEDLEKLDGLANAE